MDRLLTLEEVASRLSLSLFTVRRWASERRLPVVKIGRAVRVPEKELERFVAARTIRVRPGLEI